MNGYVAFEWLHIPLQRISVSYLNLSISFFPPISVFVLLSKVHRKLDSSHTKSQGTMNFPTIKMYINAMLCHFEIIMLEGKQKSPLLIGQCHYTAISEARRRHRAASEGMSPALISFPSSLKTLSLEKFITSTTLQKLPNVNSETNGKHSSFICSFNIYVTRTVIG